jgi:hypothetical protein
MKHPLILAIAILPSAPCAAQQICLWEDPQGNKTYASVVVKDARKVRCFDQYAPPARPTTPATTGPQRRTAEEANFPRVDSGTQKRRDDERRRILETELAEERAALEKAKLSLARAEGLGGEGRSSDAREVVSNHERNITAIEKEIARLR